MGGSPELQMAFINEYQTRKAKDNNGFFHTGDLGYLKDNKIYLKGRKKNH